jgi:NAD(P)H-dependent flavin oxidoreductase YrpB (nitropropane dioxygenase family)
VQVLKISEYVGEDVYTAARFHGKIDIGPCAAGQSSALIHDVKGAGEIIDDIMNEAEQILNKLRE